MLRDVFYYGEKPNAHPREQFAENLVDARQQCTTEHFWIINEFCDYRNFDWDFDFEFLPDEDVWAEEHNNVWPSQHQKDSGTWLCAKEHSDTIIYRNDVSFISRKNEKQSDFWVELDLIDHNKFDFSWHPDPTDPPYIYKWGCKFFPAVLKHVLEYHVPGATQEKYMSTTVELLPQTDYWVEHQAIDKHKFDMSWRPNPLDPPFIYIWGNKYIDGKLKPTLEYRSPEATTKKYMAEQLAVLPEWDNWVEVQSVDKTSFDFSWRPDPREPNLIYVFGNEHYDAIKMPTVEYHCEGATERKYMDTQVAKLAPNTKLYEHLEDSHLTDYSWMPDPDSPPYIYVWGNQWNAPEDKISVQITVPGATEYKYMPDRAIRKPCLDNWVVSDDVDITGFDFSWEPNPAAPPYIYEFATQWQKTSGPQYVVPGATEKQYVDFQQVKKLSSLANWNVPDNIESAEFDFSWHPDDTSPPYNYVFATQWAFSGGPVYMVDGATEIKYVDDQVAIAKKEMANWVYDSTEVDVETFDFSWHPYVEDQPYIYEFGTQWQKTGGPKYITPGADSSSPTKYIDTRILKAKRLPKDGEHWKCNYNVKEFDYSWHPDSTDEPFIYVFGNNLYPAEEMPTVEYHVTGATEIKYITDVTATLDDDRTNWVITQQVDEKAFDFSWKPNPKAPPYIYRWGNTYISNKYKATVEYVVPGATEIKYMTDDVAVIPEWDRWEIPKNLDTTGFNFSWRPDPLEPDQIYQFGTQHQKTGGPRYVVPGATEIKYLDFQKVVALSDKDNWKIPSNIDVVDFDFSWHPDDTDPAYIYQFGTQWALSGGPAYCVSGATEVKYMDEQTAIALPNKDNWVYDPTLIDTETFDFSWHPYAEDQPYIYEFGTQWQKTGGPKYITPGADSSSPTKYIDTRIIKSKRLLNSLDSNWKIVNNYKIKDFDYSWHPDSTEEPFIYVFGNNLYPAEEMPTVEYGVVGATKRKYVRDSVATLDANTENWLITQPIDESNFDFSWLPNPKDPPYVYRWGNKYISNKYKATIEYVVSGATEIKYMSDDVVVLPELDKWEIPNDINTEGFDFTWRPDPLEPNLIWEFGTQHQKTGGPRYVVPGATEIKYLDSQKVTALPNKDNWKIPSNVDIAGFDFSWHPDATDPAYIYQFGTQWALTGGPTYAVPGAIEIKYMDEQTAKALPDTTNWVYDSALIDISKFDFSWHPYIEDQPYIYEFGTQYQKTGGPKYITPGADSSSPIKYIDARIIKAIRLSNTKDSNWKIINDYQIKDFDWAWHPDDTEEPFIYVFGNNLYPAEEMPTIEYRVPGATQIKFVYDITAILDQDLTNWVIPDDIDTTGFDFSWKPNPTDPAFVYEFGTQHQKTGGPRYVVPSATETKYLDLFTVAKKSTPNKHWNILSNIDETMFDFSWHPDATDPPYIYAWGNQWVTAEDGPCIEYIVSGATEYRYMKDIATRTACMDNWVVPKDIITAGFDFSWEPSPKEEPFIYQFGTQWQKTGGPRYVVKNATEVKYIDFQPTTKMPNQNNFVIINGYKIKDFDYSWHPDDTEEPFIYVFGNNLYPAEECSTLEYRVSGATQVKYIRDVIATLDVNLDNWEVPKRVDTTDFDFIWIPNPNEPPYIYEFGTQWQKTGGPRYIVENATETKYLDFQKVTALADTTGWVIPENVDISQFDFSWHPDATDPAYIYQFGTQWALSGGPTYTVAGATEIKYMDTQTAISLPNKSNWVYDSTLINLESFDFSWHPYVEDQPYVYEFGTQWQKTGGPKYITPGADSSSPVKYIDTRIIKAERLPNKQDMSWVTHLSIKQFDYSWHPDNTDEPYIYVFGNNLYPAEECSTIEYRMSGATQVKYVNEIVATLDVDMDNWEVPFDIDTSEFDFSWIPNPNDPPYIYQFGTQWQKTGGPRYVVDAATEVKYLDFQKTIALHTAENWEVSENIDVTNFDFSWHPDDTDPPYIYQFGTQWALSGGPKYIVEGATEIKYMDVLTSVALPNKDNWVYDSTLIDVKTFDFSWHPYAEDQPYIYEFGTQWQKTGGPKYITPGADSSSPIKYIDTRILKATRLPNKEDTNWVSKYKIKDFDFSWHPDDTEEPFIYVFGNTLYPAEECATIEYRAAGATKLKYVHEAVATLAANMDNWEVPKGIDTAEFDFGWIPNPNEPPYIYEFGTQWQKTGGPRYVVFGAVETKYLNFQHATILPNKANWNIPDNINVSDFDFSWHPDSTEPAYTYRFGTQWALSGGPVYTVAGATEIKYMDNPSAIALPNKSNWKYDQTLIDVDSFDFSWHPYAEDEPFIYQFGTQHQKTGGPRYFALGATNSSPIKYVDTRIIKSTRLANKSKHWKLLNGYEVENFDYSWHPDETTEPYIYVFGNTQYSAEEMPTIHYVEDGAESLKYVNAVKAKLAPNMANWKVPKNIDTSSFDFSWVPHPKSPPYIYEFATAWNDRGGPRYVAPGATEHFYVEDVKAKTLTSRTNWEVPKNIDVRKFDFSWVPHPLAPPYIYQFGTKLDNNDGPRYITPDNNGEIVYLERVELENDTGITVSQYYIENTLEDLVKAHPGEIFWALRKNIDYSNFDFTWLPDIVEVAYELNYVHVFGSVDSELTQTYFVSADNYLAGENSFKFVETVELTDETLVQMFVKPDMFYVDRSNPESAARFEALKAKFGTKIQKTRYLNSWVDTINRCINRSTTELVWILNSELDYSNFDFDYYPNPWQMKMVHVFGTQWNHWGTTFMVNRESFPEDTKYVKIIEHLSTLNFVKERRAIATGCVYDVFVIDHGNQELANVLETVNNKTSGRTVTTVPYNVSYFDTLKDIIKRQQEKKEHYIWICSSVCDYADFDFSYICDPYAKDQLHVFPSGMQKFGDTFFIDVNKARELINDMEKLEDFHKVNFNSTIKVKRLPEPVIVTTDDTQIAAIKNVTGFPYATLITEDNADIEDTLVEPMNLWSPESKNILITSTGGTRIVVPVEAKDHVTNELYEYPYIKRMPKLAKSKALDIVFVSNGELVAEQNYEHLAEFTSGLANKIHRIDGINGRTEALHAAAEASETPWFFCVPAKLFVNKKFDWNYQADRMQMPKHYIFNAHNPVNDLFYGHQSMVLYNKNLVLNNKGIGLDFTLDSPHMTVELNSGIVVGDTDAHSTWRTAFREAVKLKRYSDNGDETAQQRLDVWTSVGKGSYGAWSIEGALDGLEFYDEVNGDPTQLRQSYYWDWLRDRFDSKY